MAAVRHMERVLLRLRKVIESWPEDSSRPGRDLGGHLKKVLLPKYESGAAEVSEEVVISLERLKNNYYKIKYPSDGKTIPEEASAILSTEQQKKYQAKSLGKSSRIS